MLLIWADDQHVWDGGGGHVERGTRWRGVGVLVEPEISRIAM